MTGKRDRAAQAAPVHGAENQPGGVRQAAPLPTQHSALRTPHSAKRLRELLRASPLIAPELRAHWLRVLPHLSAEQRAELAALLEPSASPGSAAPGGADAGPA